MIDGCAIFLLLASLPMLISLVISWSFPLIPSLEVVRTLVVGMTLTAIVLFFELPPLLLLPLYKAFQVSLANELFYLLFEVDTFFSIMAVVLVIVAILASISLECASFHPWRGSY